MDNKGFQMTINSVSQKNWLY